MLASFKQTMSGGGLNPLGTIAFFGDSITNQASTYTAPETCLLNDTGFPVWFSTISGQRFALARRGTTDFDFGYSTKRADEILQYVPDVIASGADSCFEVSGTNDVAQNATPATIAARRLALWTALRAGGLRVIAGAIPPAVVGATNDATNLANAAIKAAARAAGVVFVEWPDSLLSAGVANIDYFPDNIHPNALGAEIMGRHLASVLSSFLPLAQYSFLPNGHANWVTPNPYVTGTSGTKDGSTTGQLADSWTTVIGSGFSVVASKVDSWQQIAVTGSGTAASIIYSQNVTAGSGWDIGDVVRAVAEVESDEAAFALKNLNVFARFHPSGSGGYAHYNSSTAINAMANPHSPVSGILLGAPVVVPAATTRVQMYLQFQGSGTFRFRKAGVFKVT